ncbi:MAG TPA: hypothetical protein VMJ75_15460 [Candidatus Acidoferrales bacterium]|nr:hypothetical protein [Candidatus Acidoferrales bacterium]
MTKRISLSDRRSQDRRGIDAILGETAPETVPGQADKPRRLEKVTLYVRPEQVMQIEEIQLQERRRTGKRPDKSDLVQEALDLLIQKYSKTE